MKNIWDSISALPSGQMNLLVIFGSSCSMFNFSRRNRLIFINILIRNIVSLHIFLFFLQITFQYSSFSFQLCNFSLLFSNHGFTFKILNHFVFWFECFEFVFEISVGFCFFGFFGFCWSWSLRIYLFSRSCWSCLSSWCNWSFSC
jgi:hypothetical protein